LIPTQDELNSNTIIKRVDADFVNVIDFNDIHLGAIKSNKRAVQKTVEFIQSTPNTFWIGGGDSTENAQIGSKSSPFDSETHGIDSILELRDILMPIRNSCLGIKDGNHGLKRAYRSNKLPPEQVLAELLSVRFVRGILGVMMNVRKNLYVLAAAHTTKKQEASFDWLNFDAMFIEHQHTKHYNRLPIAYVNRGEKKWTVRDRLYLRSGSFLSWGGYAGENYRPLISEGGQILQLSGITNDWDMSVIERLRDFK